MKNRIALTASTFAPLVSSLVLLAGCASHHATTSTSATTTPPAPTHAAAPIAPAKIAATAISDEIRGACGITDDTSYFAFDSSAITHTDAEPLNAVAKCFSAGPMKGRSLRLVGHTDPRGTAAYNESLGESRAESVKLYLDEHGLAPAHVATSSRGAEDAKGHDETGWAHDRRVDVTLGT
jgi:peptidoglycan-associated lipoprotein